MCKLSNIAHFIVTYSVPLFVSMFADTMYTMYTIYKQMQSEDRRLNHWKQILSLPRNNIYIYIASTINLEIKCL